MTFTFEAIVSYKEMILKNLFKVVFCIFTVNANTAKADLASNMCTAFMPIIQQALTLRNAGMLIQNANDMASSAYDLNRNLYVFVVSAIRYAYDDPKDAQRQLQNGRFQKLCEKEVRGY